MSDWAWILKGICGIAVLGLNIFTVIMIFKTRKLRRNRLEGKD